MNHSVNPWSSPPPSYSTFPDDRPNQSNERTPLNQPKRKRFGKCPYILKVLMVLLLLTAITWHFVDDYSNIRRTDVQERIRQREELERLKRIEYEEVRRRLAHMEEDEHRRLVHENEDREWKEEKERQDREIEHSEAQRRWDHRQEDEQRRLAHEEEDKRRKLEKERQERIIQARESLVARREKTIQEKEDAIREDEERRKRAGLIWRDLTAEKRCLSYEKRMYHAELINIPYGEDAQSWCMKTAIDIHGVTYDHPDFCTKERQDGTVRIVGHWTVTSNEPTCKTWWGNHEKKGCYGSHKMRVEAHMFNHQEPWDNWAEMCFSTPSHFAWQSFAHPDTCENKGKYGIAGSWFIDVDESECP